MVDVHDIAREKKLRDERHDTTIRREDRLPDLAAEVDPEMTARYASIEDAARFRTGSSPACRAAEETGTSTVAACSGAPADFPRELVLASTRASLSAFAFVKRVSTFSRLAPPTLPRLDVAAGMAGG